jgi:hypothetical protein
MAEKEKKYDPSIGTSKDTIPLSQAVRIGYNQWVKKRTAESDNPDIPSIEDWARIQKPKDNP